MSTPMTPGSKSEILEDVIDLAWNNEGTITDTRYFIITLLKFSLLHSSRVNKIKNIGNICTYAHK